MIYKRWRTCEELLSTQTRLHREQFEWSKLGERLDGLEREQKKLKQNLSSRGKEGKDGESFLPPQPNNGAQL